MKILRSRVKTSRKLRNYVERIIDNVMNDDPTLSRAEAQAFELRRNLKLNLSFLRHIRKPRGCPDSVPMELHVDIDTQYDLEDFAHNLGFKSWKQVVMFHYAKKMEEDGYE